ncbi:NCBP1 [Branchiostoma lanceolatum]|uniref:Nuclear cap-binding protein subunit 1 n=1 Tax=Branchiostoma lanceolatum TaxID=7740 RepID=A0A8J9ZIY9_BRALA|nr:NCBP1 [Branchiostoma lanceolatum]
MSRRRRYSDDEDEGHGAKRRRTSEPLEIEDRLESLITRVGEKSTSSLESNLEGLASVLEADLPNYKAKILKILVDCAVQLPEKLSVYTTLVGLLNARNYNFGGEFVDAMVKRFKDSLKENKFEEGRVIVNFLADLVNCHVIAAPSLLAWYEAFVNVTLEDDIPQVRPDWFVYATLSTLPWVARELYEKKEAEMERLLTNIDAYISKRQKAHVPILRVWSSDIPHPQEEYLDCLWAQIKKMRMDKWQERQIVRPYLAFDNILCEALQHNLPPYNAPPHADDSAYPMPTVVFRMFDYTDAPEGPVMPGHHSVDRYLIEENLRRIIDTYAVDRKECAAQLLNYPFKNKIPLNYHIVEVVYGQLFQLPFAPHVDVFYTTLLIELCKLQPSSLPQVLAQATEMLYERIDTMNIACVDRLVNWFSHHLSNFQFRWSWDDWVPCVELDSSLYKPKFVQEVLGKCVRMSYHQRIIETVPDTYGPLLPHEPNHIYKYEQEGAGSLPGTVAAHQLIASIKAKSEPEELINILKDLPNPKKDDDGEAAFNPLKIDVFVQTVLHLGCKSFSHAFSALAKFHAIFRELAEEEEAQIHILRTMYDVWKKHPQMMFVLVDKMLRTQIVNCSAVANWLFSHDMSQDFTRLYVWEIMHSTIRKMNKHVEKCNAELTEGQQHTAEKSPQVQKELADAQQKTEKSGDKIGSEDEMQDIDGVDEEEIERLQERLESAQSEQKKLFLVIFQRFIMVLTEHLGRCETSGKDFNTAWYRYSIERLQQIFLQHHSTVTKYLDTLENLLFTSDTDAHILQVFQQFCALRA